MVRLVAAVFSVLLVSVGAFFTFAYFDRGQLLLLKDPTHAIDFANELLVYLLVASLCTIVCIALFVYVLLTRKVAARKIAYKLSQDALLSQEQFRRLYELSPVPYVIVKQDGTIDRPNTAAVRFLGVPYEELVNTDLFDFLSTPEQPDKIHVYKEQAKRRVPLEKKEVLVTPSGKPPRWSLLSVQDLSGSYGAHKGLATLVDIHEQKELDRVKTEFLSLASHQLRAPLANLKWYIEFLLQRRASALSEEVQGYLHKMYRRNADMIDLVNTLLNLSRIEMGRIKVETAPVTLTTLIQNILEELEPAMKEKQLSLDSQLEPDIVQTTDGKLLRIVLQNLLTNAIRYTPENGNIRLALYRKDGGVYVEVEDSGIGIPLEEQNHIFEKLYRAQNAKHMEANGNGIGLYMCKALVESLHGSISFTSVVDQGTTFTVFLPN